MTKELANSGYLEQFQPVARARFPAGATELKSSAFTTQPCEMSKFQKLKDKA